MINQDEYLEYIEGLTAGITHEINNRLSVIKENSGLLEDLLFMAEKAGVENPFSDRMKSSLASIKESVKKGAEATSDLNRLAHLARKEKTMLAVQDAASLVARINTKKAERTGISITTENPSSGVCFLTVPALFCKLIHMLINAAMIIPSSGTTMILGSDKTDGQSRLYISPDKKCPGFAEGISSSKDITAIKSLASALDVIITIDDSGISLFNSKP